MNLSSACLHKPNEAVSLSQFNSVFVDASKLMSNEKNHDDITYEDVYFHHHCSTCSLSFHLYQTITAPASLDVYNNKISFIKCRIEGNYNDDNL